MGVKTLPGSQAILGCKKERITEFLIDLSRIFKEL
jgi:hypothetical protein